VLVQRSSEDFGKFFRREILPRLNLKNGGPAPRQLGPVAEGMENLSAYTILQLLAANPVASGLSVQWGFSDVEAGGWAKRTDFVKPVDQGSRFLVVTEGSSDAAIIGKAFRLLRPHIADFFDFVDTEEGYSFSGTGNVFRFVQGLISIRLMNNVIVVYDNDAEGAANLERTQRLSLPPNMVALKLPDITDLGGSQRSGRMAGMWLTSMVGQLPSSATSTCRSMPAFGGRALATG
jgi:hypothetical protein